MVNALGVRTNAGPLIVGRGVVDLGQRQRDFNELLPMRHAELQPVRIIFCLAAFVRTCHVMTPGILFTTAGRLGRADRRNHSSRS